MYTKMQLAIAKKTNKLNDLYAQRVSELIRAKYSVDAELSIHRQRDTKPEEFEEYRIPQEPILVDETIDFVKDSIRNKGLSIVNFLKAFPRKKRLEMVDMLRGAIPVPIDFKELNMLAKVLDLTTEDIYPLWEKRMKQVLESAGMNIYANSALVEEMFACAKKFIDVE